MEKYLQRIIATVSYIEQHLEQDLNVENICQFSHLSKFHFHRQFSEYTGVSLVNFIRLMRLRRAAYKLAYRKEFKIVDIALGCGYESHEAFTRAFKKHFHVSPSEFKKRSDWHFWQKHYEPILKLRAKLMEDKVDFDVNVVNFPETKIAIMSHQGSPQLLSETIKRFIQWRRSNRLPPNKYNTYNLVYHDPDVTAAEDYRFDLCCAIDSSCDIDTSLVEVNTIPKGKCAVIRHIGNELLLANAVRFLYSDWLISTNVELRDFPLFFHRVSLFPDVPEHEMITDVYLPIKSTIPIS